MTRNCGTPKAKTSPRKDKQASLGIRCPLRKPCSNHPLPPNSHTRARTRHPRRTWPTIYAYLAALPSSRRPEPPGEGMAGQCGDRHVQRSQYRATGARATRHPHLPLDVRPAAQSRCLHVARGDLNDPRRPLLLTSKGLHIGQGAQAAQVPFRLMIKASGGVTSASAEHSMWSACKWRPRSKIRRSGAASGPFSGRQVSVQMRLIWRLRGCQDGGLAALAGWLPGPCRGW